MWISRDQRNVSSDHLVSVNHGELHHTVLCVAGGWMSFEWHGRSSAIASTGSCSPWNYWMFYGGCLQLCHFVLPVEAENPLQTANVEAFEVFNVATVQDPGIQQYSDTDSIVNCNFGRCWKVTVEKDTVWKTAEGSWCEFDTMMNISWYVSLSSEDTSEIRELWDTVYCVASYWEWMNECAWFKWRCHSQTVAGALYNKELYVVSQCRL